MPKGNRMFSNHHILACNVIYRDGVITQRLIFQKNEIGSQGTFVIGERCVVCDKEFVGERGCSKALDEICTGA